MQGLQAQGLRRAEACGTSQQRTSALDRAPRAPPPRLGLHRSRARTRSSRRTRTSTSMRAPRGGTPSPGSTWCWGAGRTSSAGWAPLMASSSTRELAVFVERACGGREGPSLHVRGRLTHPASQRSSCSLLCLQLRRVLRGHARLPPGAAHVSHCEEEWRLTLAACLFCRCGGAAAAQLTPPAPDALPPAAGCSARAASTLSSTAWPQTTCSFI